MSPEQALALAPLQGRRWPRGRGRTTALHVVLTPEQRAELMRWQQQRTRPSGVVRRGRIVLLVADGMPLAAVARTVGIGRRHVTRWVQRFLAHGLDGLEDAPRRLKTVRNDE